MSRSPATQQRPTATSKKAKQTAAQTHLAEAAQEAVHCQRCPLYRDATQVVFGEGPAPAAIMMVGEQPGDREDLAGHPFVGPAGRVLDQALEAIGLDRRSVYVTNAVKHFKHEMRGKRRIHKPPNQGEVSQCRWWLDQELALVEPKLVIALGATAARALMGRTLVLGRERGQLLRWADGRRGLATVHPSAVLRMPDEAARHQALADLIRDLRQALQLVETSGDLH